MYYFDTSALVKLVVEEAESQGLRQLLATIDPDDLVTSALTRAELLRAALRRDHATTVKAREVLGGIAQITVTEALLDEAGRLPPASLRSLDAIHLASAAELRPDLTAFVAYDARLRKAAEARGFATLAPQ